MSERVGAEILARGIIAGCGLDRLTLRVVAGEASALISDYCPEGSAPVGFKLAIVRALRKAEQRGVQACVEHFGICDDCSPLPSTPHESETP